MTLNDWPAGERPREKLMERGAGALSDAELLAIMLRTGRPGLTAIDVARHLLERFGGFRALVEAAIDHICPELSMTRHAEIRAAVELARRYLMEGLQRGHTLTSTEATKQFLVASLRSHRREVFACLFLDNTHRLIRFEEMFHGTVSSAQVNLREIAVRALHLNACALIVAHNHPSGVPSPSAADRALTERLRSVMALVEVRLLDHFIVGDGAPVSFAEQGWL